MAGATCASAKPCQIQKFAPVENLVKCKTLGLMRQWPIKCKNVVVGLRHYTSGQSIVSSRNFFI
jgi:hypothetical protein